MIEVTKRVYQNGRFEYIKEPQTFKTYAECIRHYNGEQAWFDKQWHRFTVGATLYYMKKITNI